MGAMGKEEADDDGVTEMGGLDEGGATAAVGDVHVGTGKGKEGTNLLDLTSVRSNVECRGTLSVLTVDVGKIFVVEEGEEGSVWLVGKGGREGRVLLRKYSHIHYISRKIKAINIQDFFPPPSSNFPSLPPFVQQRTFRTQF